MKFKGEVEIAYSDAGKGEKTIVLLHGHPFDRSMWSEQIAALESKYRIVAPDLRGYGESGLRGEVSTMSRMAEDVNQLLGFLRLEKVILAGLSMGGYAALEFYSLFPEKISALVLADTKASADAEEARKNRFETAEKLLLEGMEPLAKEMLPKVLAPETLENSPETVARVREMMLKTTPAGAAAGLRGMARRNDHITLLEKTNVPTLIIVGEKDELTPIAEAEKMNRAITNSLIVKISRAGHLPPVENPAEFNRALSDFLADLE
jgi:3-oxoadipate enol-lactonase